MPAQPSDQTENKYKRGDAVRGATFILTAEWGGGNGKEYFCEGSLLSRDVLPVTLCYRISSYIHIQSVPRSKHTPSQL
jgi:hypothetical protein